MMEVILGTKNKSKYQGKFKAGDSFGSWTVVNGKIHGSPAEMDVTCVCGAKKRVDIYTLVKGRSKSCGCIPQARSGENAPNWQGVKGVPKTVLTRALKAAERHGAVRMTTEQAATVYLAQNGSCSITGTPLSGPGGGTASASYSSSPTLVRYDNSQPYTVTNTAWVSNNVGSLGTALGMTGVYTVANNIVNSTQPNIFTQLGIKPVEDK
jgi:hypothetical protein